jgi:hypothetical protein
MMRIFQIILVLWLVVMPAYVGTICLFFPAKARAQSLWMVQHFGIPMFADGQRRSILSKWYRVRLVFAGVFFYVVLVGFIFAMTRGCYHSSVGFPDCAVPMTKPAASSAPESSMLP